MKKLIIAGGTGFLGQALIRHFEKEYDDIVILSRTENKTDKIIRYIKWDAKHIGTWSRELEEATAILNLCGKSVDCRYTKKNKAIIFSSRLESTKVIREAILACKKPPLLWINGASATIYEHSETIPMTEKGKIGHGFSVDVCKAWEQTFYEVKLPHTRQINIRLSMVMGKTGGVLPALRSLVKMGMGGTMGNGKQQVSWMHVSDFCNMVDWMMKNDQASGIYNGVAPNPVTNKNLMKMLRQQANINFGLPASKWMLEIGAFFMRTETELILKSRYSYPERLLKEGFDFKYATIESCLENL